MMEVVVWLLLIFTAAGPAVVPHDTIEKCRETYRVAMVDDEVIGMSECVQVVIRDRRPAPKP